MALPSGYTPLEYIESTGSQYIDTGYIATSENQRVVCDVTFTATHVAQSICGSQNASSGMGTIIPHSLDGTTFDLYCAGGFPIKVAGSLNTRYALDITANQGTMTASINGTQYSGTYSGTIISGHAIAVFANNVGGSYNQVINGLRMWGLSLYDNGVEVRAFVPAMRTSGEVGLIDTLTGMFYGNAGSGVFIAGPVIPDVPATDPNGFAASDATMQAVLLVWKAAPIEETYRLYRNGALIYEGPGTYYLDSGLIRGMPYSYRVAGYNGSEESTGLALDITTRSAPVLITDRTFSDVSAKRRKSFYNALDLIRVGEAMAYLEECFAAVGISVTVSPKLDWQLADIPTHIQALHYLTDIGVLRGKLTEFRGTVSLPGSLTALTWASANDIETILLGTEKLIQDIILSYRHYTGRAISGVNVLP